MKNQEILKQKFRSGKFDGDGGHDKDFCDICTNSSFLNEAKENTDPHMSYMLNLCDDCADKTAEDREVFKDRMDAIINQQRFNSAWDRIKKCLVGKGRNETNKSQ